MIPDLRNTKESPGHSPVICRKMVGIFCFLLKIHPCRQRVRRLPLLFLGRDGGCAIALLGTVAAESGMTAAVNDSFGGVLWEVRAVGFVFFAVQHAVLAAVGGIDPQAAVGQVGGGRPPAAPDRPVHRCAWPHSLPPWPRPASARRCTSL